MNRDEHLRRLQQLMHHPPEGFALHNSGMYRDDKPLQPRYVDYECMFAAGMLSEARPETILDVGSYWHFVIGLLADHTVTLVDVRERHINFGLSNAKMLICDAKKLDLPSESFDAVLSLCTLEHCGLGRYGDEFDLDGDKKVFSEMRRVLKPGGALIFTTTITQAAPSICFNAHRIYSYNMIEQFCEGLILDTAMFIDRHNCCFVPRIGITAKFSDWSIYCGYWRKE